METVTVYAAESPAANPPSTVLAVPAAASPDSDPQSSPSASSNSQSNDIALWLPIGIVIAVVVVLLISWACVSRRFEFYKRARGHPDAMIGQTRDKRTGKRVFITKADMQEGRYPGRAARDDTSSD